MRGASGRVMGWEVGGGGREGGGDGGRQGLVARCSRKREFMIVTMKEKVELCLAMYSKERVVNQIVHEETRAVD